MTYVYVQFANNMESVRNADQAQKNITVSYAENLMNLKIMILMRMMNLLPSLKMKKDRDSTKPGFLCTLKGRKLCIRLNQSACMRRIIRK